MRPALWTLVIVGSMFGLLFALERAVPLRRAVRSLWLRLLINLATSALAFLVAAILVRPATMAAVNWSFLKSIGFAPVLSLPPAARFVLSFLWMDLTFYWWHVANHRLPFLWRFHNVHHVDPDLDVSTGFRFHFGEVALSSVFRVVQVAVGGVSMPAFAAYELIFQANTLFHHSNVRLWIRLERWLNRLLVTPRMHGIHHSQNQAETNSNYGVVFPWWDRLHRTLRLNVPQSEIKIGIPGYAAPEDNRFDNLLLMPFRKQRDYWPRREGAAGLRQAIKPGGGKTRLAE